MNKTIKMYDMVVSILTKDFIKKYYNEDNEDILETDYFIIWEWWRLAPDTVWIGDQFRSISEMYEAIKNDISEEKLFNWYDYSLNKHQLNSNGWNETIVNLTSFALWAIEYTKEEEEEDDKRIDEAYKLLDSEIEKWK